MVSSALSLHALGIAEKEIGHGESGVNNRGTDVDRYRIGGRVGGEGGAGAWCAAFVSYCFRMSAAELSLSLPFDTSRGAKRLVRNIGKAGAFVDPDDPLTMAACKGAVICWHRGALGPMDWRGHVGLIHSYNVADGMLTTLEGNKMPQVGKFYYAAGLWRKRLYRIAVI